MKLIRGVDRMFRKMKKLLCVLSVISIIGTLGVPFHPAYAAPVTITGTDANGFAWSYNGTSVTITGYSGSGGAITIPSTEIVNEVPEPVTGIGGYAFFNKGSISTVTIPSCITSIAGLAFYRCTGLTTVNLANGLTSIGNDAFGYCFALANFSLPNTLTTIGNSVFEYTGLQSITIPGSVTSMGTQVFYNSALESITVQEGVTNIGEYTFYGCSSLTAVTLPSSLTSIRPYTFHGCSKLASITLPSNVASIGNQAFYGCSLLVSVSVFNNATTYGSSVFTGAPTSLTLYGFTGSTTDTYATNNSISFVPIAVSSISMKSNPTKTQYVVGETLDVAGAAITVLYNSGSTQDMAVTSNMCNVTTFTASGQQQVNVTLGEQTTSFEVTVTNPVTGITQLPVSLTVDIGSPQTLTAAVIPSGADNPEITWSSDNGSVATVDSNGLVTGISAGTAVITATSVDGGYATSCNVTVQFIHVTGILSLPLVSTLGVGQTLTLTPSIYPTNASDKSVAWSSSDPSVASIDGSGVVTANAPGSATITVTTNDGSITATTESVITVVIAVSNIDISGISAIYVGENATLSASIQPMDAANKQISWWSSNPSIVSVDQNGNIEGISVGTATIHADATDVGGVKATFDVTVGLPPITGLTPAPIDMTGYTDPLEAALAAEQMWRITTDYVTEQITNIEYDQAAYQRQVEEDEAYFQLILGAIQYLQFEADAIVLMIQAIDATPGAGYVSLDLVLAYTTINLQIYEKEAAMLAHRDTTIPANIYRVVTTEETYEALRAELVQVTYNKISSAVKAEILQAEQAALIDELVARAIGTVGKFNYCALGEAGLNIEQIINICENSSGVQYIDDITSLAGDNNISLGTFEGISAVKPANEGILFGMTNAQGFDAFKHQAMDLNTKLLDSPMYADLSNVIPELENAEHVLFFIKQGIATDHYLTYQELLYVLSHPEILSKTTFVTGFFPPFN